jgi:hypothetical protein
MRLARRFLLLISVISAATALGADRPAAAQGTPLPIGAATIPFNRSDAAERRIGRLLWRGGLVFSAGAPEFGGWSDLHVTDDGSTLMALSEEATWLTATMTYDAEGNLAGLIDGRIGPLLALNGKPIVGRSWTSAEALAHLPDGSWIVGFERNHRLWRYAPLDGTPVPIDGPAEIGRQPLNAGIKAMTATGSGVIALSENYSLKPGTVVGWIGTAAGRGFTWQTFHYTADARFRPTAMAALPDGSFAVLERSIEAQRGARSRVMLVPAADFKAGASVTGTELAVLATPHPADNFEGISAGRGKRGETLLWLNSNDNFNPLQRNLLLMFEIAP